MNPNVRQIKTYIEQNFTGKIDLADCDPNGSESKFLSRGLVALAAMRIAEVNTTLAVDSITDGQKDNGLDGVVVNSAAGRIYLIQAKWSDSGAKTIEVGDTHKFIQGCKDMLACNWPAFNSKIQAKKVEIEATLNQVNTQVGLVIVYPSTNPIPDESMSIIQAFMDENNDGGEVVFLRTVQLSALKSIALSQVSGVVLPTEATLFEWGRVLEPYEAVYGQVACSDLAAWFDQNGTKLFSANIRSFVGDTDVNLGIIRTLTHEPKSFWYMNNGVTAICDRITKKPIGGNTKDSGSFVFENLRVVNGAQTVGAIAVASSKAPEKVSLARVSVRVISKQNGPLEFEEELTTKTNTQNRIDARDFVALDPIQTRLKTELLPLGVDYLFRAGEKPIHENAFDVQEAAVARACAATDVALCVYAKRNIGELLDRKSKQYPLLFSDALTGIALWEQVQRLRKIETALNGMKAHASGRKAQLLVHGNRVFAFVLLNKADYWISDDTWDQKGNAAVAALVGKALTYLNANYLEAYLAVFFKNAEKCLALATHLKSESSA